VVSTSRVRCNWFGVDPLGLLTHFALVSAADRFDSWCACTIWQTILSWHGPRPFTWTRPCRDRLDALVVLTWIGRRRPAVASVGFVSKHGSTVPLVTLLLNSVDPVLRNHARAARTHCFRRRGTPFDTNTVSSAMFVLARVPGDCDPVGPVGDECGFFRTVNR